jgi:hypothetical protein
MFKLQSLIPRVEEEFLLLSRVQEGRGTEAALRLVRNALDTAEEFQAFAQQLEALQEDERVAYGAWVTMSAGIRLGSRLEEEILSLFRKTTTPEFSLISILSLRSIPIIGNAASFFTFVPRKAVSLLGFLPRKRLVKFFKLGHHLNRAQHAFPQAAHGLYVASEFITSAFVPTRRHIVSV